MGLEDGGSWRFLGDWVLTQLTAPPHARTNRHGLRCPSYHRRVGNVAEPAGGAERGGSDGARRAAQDYDCAGGVEEWRVGDTGVC